MLGSYTIAVTVTDNTGQTFADSVGVVISSLSVFSLDVTADKLVVWPGEAVNLVGDRTGGTANFNYSWSALNEAGATAGTLTATSQNGLTNDTTNIWTAPPVRASREPTACAARCPTRWATHSPTR